MLGSVSTKRHLIRFASTLVNPSLALTLSRSCGCEFGFDGDLSSLKPELHASITGDNIRTCRFMIPHVQNGYVAWQRDQLPSVTDDKWATSLQFVLTVSYSMLFKAAFVIPLVQR